MGTHDICLRNTKRISSFINASRESGFQCEDVTLKLDGTALLIENPTAVMVQYQKDGGEHRSYSGHWTTVLTRMIKSPANTG